MISENIFLKRTPAPVRTIQGVMAPICVGQNNILGDFFAEHGNVNTRHVFCPLKSVGFSYAAARKNSPGHQSVGQNFTFQFSFTCENAWFVKCKNIDTPLVASNETVDERWK